MKDNNICRSKYVALLIVFFIPLLSNLLHYVIIEHEFGKRNSKLEWIDGSNVHYCDQYLFKIYPAIEVPPCWIDVCFFVLDHSIVLQKQEEVEQTTSRLYFNRGPPLRC